MLRIKKHSPRVCPKQVHSVSRAWITGIAFGWGITSHLYHGILFHSPSFFVWFTPLCHDRNPNCSPFLSYQQLKGLVEVWVRVMILLRGLVEHGSCGCCKRWWFLSFLYFFGNVSERHSLLNGASDLPGLFLKFPSSSRRIGPLRWLRPIPSRTNTTQLQHTHLITHNTNRVLCSQPDR